MMTKAQSDPWYIVSLRQTKFSRWELAKSPEIQHNEILILRIFWFAAARNIYRARRRCQRVNTTPPRARKAP